MDELLKQCRDALAHARWLERERERQPHLGDKFQASADAIRNLCAALSHPQLRDGAEGWVLVPKEPTEKMVDAGYDFTADPCWREDLADGYRAMLAAAPPPPSPAEPKEEGR